MTQVLFKRLTDNEISAYMASGEWQGKAGAYGIQGRAGAFVKRINGSYSNVVGLCLNVAENLLSEHLGSLARDSD
jgi:septum formation protein